MSLLIGKVTQNIPDIYSQAFWSPTESEENNSTASLSALGVRNNFAKHPLLAVLENRRSTFLTYPHTYMSVINLDLLADAGYFYQGKLNNLLAHIGISKGLHFPSLENLTHSLLIDFPVSYFIKFMMYLNFKISPKRYLKEISQLYTFAHSFFYGSD